MACPWASSDLFTEARRGLYFSIQPFDSGDLYISSAGCSGDTIMYLLQAQPDGSGGQCMVDLAYNDDIPDSGHSCAAVVADVQAGQEYIVFVSAYETPPDFLQDFPLTVSFDCRPGIPCLGRSSRSSPPFQSMAGGARVYFLCLFWMLFIFSRLCFLCMCVSPPPGPVHVVCADHT